LKTFLRYAIIAILVSTPVAAQEDDGTFLEGLLERSLAGEGRNVSVTGFRGALSSTATIERVTFADPEGVWLTVEDVVLDWNRLALLRGRLSVNQLEAGSILLARLPQESGDAAMPSPEASGFQLPELPVAVQIGTISSPSITFGQPVFGIESSFSLEGRLSLEGGEGAGALDVTRIDGPEGRFAVEASFSNATEVLALSVDLREAAGGILATLSGIPGEPSVDLTVSGQGPLSNFEATLALATDGDDRLSGVLALGGEDVVPGAARPFRAELSGDIAPLFAPAYQDFFGDQITLVAAGVRGADGALDLDGFTLAANTIALEGAVATGPDGRPRSFRIDGRIASPEGDPVLLPLPGPPTRVGVLTLEASFDAAADDAWTGRFLIDGLDRPGFTAEQVLLDGGGNILGIESAERNGVTANFDFAAVALDLGDPAAGEALGERVTGRMELTSFDGEPLRIARLDISGETYALEASGTLDIADRDLAVEGRAQVVVEDLTAFSGVAGRPLSGDARLALSGRGEILGGRFDAVVEGRTVDLSVGDPRVDSLVRGATDLLIDAQRDVGGIAVRAFRLASPEAQITAQGEIRSDATRLTLSAVLEDAGILVPGFDGRHSLALDARADGSLWGIDGTLNGETLSGSVAGLLDLTDPVPAFGGTVALEAASVAPLAALGDLPDLSGALSLGFEGAVTADLSRFDLRLTMEERGLRTGQPDIDGLLGGGLSLALDAVRDPGGPMTIRSLSAASESLSASVTGVVSGLPDALTAIDAGVLDTADFDGRLAIDIRDLAPFGPLAGLPGLAGTLEAEASGDFALDLSRFDLDLAVREEDLSTGRADLDALLDAGASARLAARRETAGPVAIESLGVTTPALSLSVEGMLSGLPEALVPPPPDLADSAVFEGSAALSASDLAAVGPLAGLPGLGGALDARLEGNVSANLAAFDLRLSVDGAGFRTGIAEADAYLAGTTELRLDIARDNDRLDIRGGSFAAPGVTARVAGSVTGADGTFTASARLDDLGRIVPGFAGPATAEVARAPPPAAPGA
jgi:translocation and assembly module TamB